jgi:hypothetical protein
MQTDLYTKAVLTVIALALSAIALQHAIPSAFAQSTLTKVIICESQNNCASVDGSGLRVSPR